MFPHDIDLQATGLPECYLMGYRKSSTMARMKAIPGLLVSMVLFAMQAPRVPAVSPYVDVHTHIEREVAEKAIEIAAQAMQGDNRAKYLFMPSPFDEEGHGSFDIELLRMISRKYGDKISILG